MTQLTFAHAVRVSRSPNRGMANLELYDASGATIAAAQLNAMLAAILISDLADELELSPELAAFAAKIGRKAP